MNNYQLPKAKPEQIEKPLLWYKNLNNWALILSSLSLIISIGILTSFSSKKTLARLMPSDKYSNRVTITDVLPTDTVFLQFTDRICHEELFRSHIYEDTRGNRTIGCGWNLEVGISETLAKLVVEWQVVEIRRALEESWLPFKDQTDVIQWGLIDAGFNLGVHGLLEFKHMLNALEHRNYTRAIAEISNSKWFHDRDTKPRAQKLINEIRGSN